ncbi:Tetratricopeptide repeat protein like [Actinidia chinensis var. chinensis]|uniref:Tetratricopeptide repeat protein like n=1 Tax=Actinidia chinensis var. chinensis TaxID=1590841 RepID=A0A2R6QR28_ACTCC|nr:uncharacterized protein LOC130791422 [Actinidia eriantha]PSS13573.1 Tetratricopeptide repeat protein like [Actinidia chinensis var. chinensis]
MGNCQAVDAAALVIQHPSGSIERMYWPISVSEVMKTNPGHYVSLIIPLPTSDEQNTDERTVRFTRVKLLRPSDTLVLGRAYRLVTTQEVMKVLRAKKYAKMKKNQSDSGDKSRIDQERKSSNCEEETEKPELEKKSPAMRHERQMPRPGSTNFAAARSKSWRPSLQSISEGGS